MRSAHLIYDLCSASNCLFTIEIDKVDKMGDKIILNVAKNELLKVML
jgi:hypothetical protein